jgi:hypothetical protein
MPEEPEVKVVFRNGVGLVTEIELEKEARD